MAGDQYAGGPHVGSNDPESAGSPRKHGVFSDEPTKDLVPGEQQVGASGPFRLIQADFAFNSANIATTGFVVGALVAGEILTAAYLRIATGFDVATSLALFSNNASGLDMLNGGTLDLAAEGAASPLFTARTIQDGQRGAAVNCNVAAVIDTGGNATGAGTLYLVVLTPNT